METAHIRGERDHSESGPLDRMLTIDDMIDRFPGTTRGSWAQFRFKGAGGPPYVKVGKKIYYSERSVAAWLEATRRTSTAVA